MKEYVKNDQRHPEDRFSLYPASHYLKELEEDLKTAGSVPKINITSLPKFNRKIWGLETGLTVVGARPSNGKSAFCLQLAQDVLMQGKIVVFISLEMTQKSILKRMFCNLYNIDNSELRSGRYNNDLQIRTDFAKFCQEIEKRFIIITFGMGKCYQELNDMLNELPQSPDLVIVDYIQSIKTGTRDTREETNEYIRYFRQLSLERDFCGILVSQINRGTLQGAGNEPNLGQLKNTGVLEEHADKVILLHWDYIYTQDQTNMGRFKIHLAKNREGRTGIFYCEFEPQHYKFIEVYPQDYYKDKR